MATFFIRNIEQKTRIQAEDDRTKIQTASRFAYDRLFIVSPH